MTINNSISRKFVVYLSLMAMLTLLTYWIFIYIYRINAFDIVPHDDYAPLLLYILGEEGGRLIGSPFTYRIFSVAAAVPFYYMLPFFEFSRLENVNVTYLRAVEALAMVSYVSMLFSCALIFLITCKKFSASSPTGIIASLVALLLFQFSAYSGVDPIGILMVCLLIYYSGNPVIFGIFIILSAGFNEKISLIFSILMVSRVLLAKDKRFMPYAILSVLAFAIYLAFRTLLNLPGGGHQMQLMSILTGAFVNVSELTSLRGFVLGVVPVTTLIILYVLAAKEWKLNPSGKSNYFSIVDISALLGLLLISMGIGIQVNFGRVGMFCFPFYLPLAAIHVVTLMQKLDGDVPSTG